MIAANDNTRKRELLARIRTFSIGFLLTIGGGALAATFNLFQPATGVLVGNASTYVTSAAANSDIISLWSGTCSNATYLRGDGSCQTPPGTATGANPSASVGLTAVNGSASSYMRSDAAPALSQAITPAWTGLHKFTANYTGAGTGALEINAAFPIVRQVESAAAADSRYWRNYVNSSRMTFDICNDAENVCRNWLDTGRSGNAVTDIVFGNATDNPTYVFAGNGSATFGGPVTGSSNGVNAALLTKGTTTGIANVSYVSFVDSSNVQAGAIGDYSDTDSDIYIVNSTSSANINLTTTGTGQIVFNGVPRFNSSTATTVGAAGGATALPATPSGYLIVSIAGTSFKIPYYAN